ncbi:MAG TPA: hypothetical protein VJC39_02545 [Candidatus Nanoarchaeia archaeon]|nr:hypothetical protein [Candidatus Nanoarchaeia archaeon]
MSLDKVLDEKEIYCIGIYWTDDEWNKRKEIVWPLIREEADLCAYAGIYFLDDRYQELKDELEQRVLSSPDSSYIAILRWNDNRIGPVLQQAADAVSKSPRHSYLAGIKLSEVRFNEIGYLICRGVLESKVYTNIVLEVNPETWESCRKETLLRIELELEEIRKSTQSEQERERIKKGGRVSVAANDKAKLSLSKEGNSIIETPSSPNRWYQKLWPNKS